MSPSMAFNRTPAYASRLCRAPVGGRRHLIVGPHVLERVGLRFLLRNPADYALGAFVEPVHEFHLTKEQLRDQCDA
jgi:hypothetical protein